MVFTDPPYNVNYVNSAKDKMRQGSRDPERQPGRAGLDTKPFALRMAW